ncbi:MAG: MFS transporter [Candidatus Omnitrophota bacterium]
MGIKPDIHALSCKDEPCRRSLRFSFLDGIFASGTNGFTQDYFVPFVLLLSHSVQHVSILNAFQNLFSSLAQLFSADLTVWLKSRKKIIVSFVFLQALMLLPIVVLALWHSATPSIFILLVVLFSSFNALATPAWSSLMSDLVREEKRGMYFGWRSRILGLVSIASAFLAGFILNRIGGTNPFYGFAIVFFCAFVFRMFSWFFLTRMHEPPLQHSPEHQFTLLEFLARFQESNFAKFVFFVAMMNFSVNLASPFFAVLMIKDLKFSYLLYAAITVAATLTVCLLMGRWGRFADKIGNLKVIRWTAPLIGFVPLLWVFNRHPAFLFFAQIFSGFAWAGFNLSASNFIYDAVRPEKRTRCIAYFNVFNGLALCCGSLLGGLLLMKLPPLFGYNILTLFMISAFFRLLVAFWMPAKLKEVRTVSSVNNLQVLLHMTGVRPLKFLA